MLTNAPMKSVATTGTPVPLNFYRINSLEMGTGRGGGGVVVVQGGGMKQEQQELLYILIITI